MIESSTLADSDESAKKTIKYNCYNNVLVFSTMISTINMIDDSSIKLHESSFLFVLFN